LIFLILTVDQTWKSHHKNGNEVVFHHGIYIDLG
jgi:hypothetical protein